MEKTDDGLWKDEDGNQYLFKPEEDSESSDGIQSDFSSGEVIWSGSEK